MAAVRVGTAASHSKRVMSGPSRASSRRASHSKLHGRPPAPVKSGKAKLVGGMPMACAISAGYDWLVLVMAKEWKPWVRLSPMATSFAMGAS